MIKVLQIIDNINVDAGVASSVMNIYRHINRQKVQFDFLVCHVGTERGKTYANEIKEYGGRIYYFGTPLSLKSIWESTSFVKRFFKENANQYDIVHLQTPTIAEFTIKYAKRYGVKNIITHSHSTMTSLNSIKIVINSYLISRIKRYTNHFWACSTEAAEFLFGKKFCKENDVKIIRNAIDPQRYRFALDKRIKMRRKLNIDEKTVFVHVSNFSPIKNMKFMIPVIKKVCNERDDACFMFIGDGVTRNSVEAELHNYVAEKCIFVGSTDEVWKYLQAADAFFMPSINEGFGIAAVEAQANGLKCFLSDTITREVNVGLVQYIPLNESSWFEALIKVHTSLPSDREKASAKFDDSDLNIENVVNSIQKLYVSMT